MGQSPSVASQASERSVLIETRRNAAFGGTHCTEEHQWTQAGEDHARSQCCLRQEAILKPVRLRRAMSS